MDGYIMIHYCDYTDISWYCYFCGCLLAAQPVGDHFKGLVTYVNVLTFRHLPRACHLFWQGSGPVYVVIANMKLVALLCIGWHSKLPDPGHKDLAKLCKLRWSPFALPFWLDQPWYLWLSGSDILNRSTKVVAAVMSRIFFGQSRSLPWLHWMDCYSTVKHCGMRRMTRLLVVLVASLCLFFGGRLHICAMVKRWIICLYLNSLYILSMYLIIYIYT